MMPATVTPLVPQVGFIGSGDVFLAPSATRPGVVHIVVNVGTTWACSCPATHICKHIKAAQEVVL
jgi:hypothetical protein